MGRMQPALRSRRAVTSAPCRTRAGYQQLAHMMNGKITVRSVPGKVRETLIYPG